MSAASADAAKRRVKLYVLNASRQWDDKGTGHITSCYHEPLDGMSLLVQNETDGSLLLESKIQLDTQYQKQQGTLIVWTESDNYDLALSFQDRDGCDEIWAKICQVQGRNPLHYDIDNDDEQEEVRINLVECDHDKLHLILDQITAFSQTNRKRDALAAEYIENDYIGKLLAIFRMADEAQDIDTLHKLYEIFKQLFLYDRPTLTEVMLSDLFLMDVIGVFEYEPPQQEENGQQESSSTATSATSLFSSHNDNNNTTTTTTTTNATNQVEPTDNHSPVSNDNNNNNNSNHDDVTEEGDSEEVEAKAIEAETMKEDNDEDQDGRENNGQGDQKDSEEEKLNNKLVSNNQQPQLRQDDDEQIVDDQEKQPQDQSDGEIQSSNTESTSETPMIQQKPKQEFVRKWHRKFLQDGSTFKEVIPFCNRKLVDKIHQTYRVQYLQSSVLPSPSILEENAYNALNNILFFNKVEIVTMIQDNEEFLQTLFNQIISNETGVERKRELVKFLREYCIFSQTIQPKQRESFFQTLASLKILSAVEVALSSSDPDIKSAAIDIFTYLVEFSPHMTREHAVQQREGLIEPPNSNAQTANILKLVIEHITTDRDPELGTATQLSCIIRLILDPENMPGDDIAKHSFLEFFYYTCMQSLLEPIKNATTPNGDIQPSANDRKTAQLLSIMMELLTFFIEHHFGHLRKCIANSDLLTRIISLMKSRHKFLVLSVVRFFRRLLAMKDHVYFELIMNEDLFSPIIQVLKNNNGRYNLLDSAILEMFEYIVSEDLHALMGHILTNYGPFLESIEYVNTFKAMRQKKEALHDTIRDNGLKSHRAGISDTEMYAKHMFGNHSRRDIDGMFFTTDEADVDPTDEVGDIDTDDKDLDPDSGDAPVDSDPDGLDLSDIDITMHSRSRDRDEDGEDEEEDVEDEDDIQMDEEDVDDEVEPQFKKKKTK